MSIILNGTTGITTPDVSVTAQSTAAITANRLSSDGTIINVQKDGTTVGSIAVANSDLHIGQGNTNLRFNDGSNEVIPTQGTGATSDNITSLGSSSRRFKDLYLGGGVYLGGTGAANYLDDYEEGEVTLGFAFGGGTTGITYDSANGCCYTKVGRVVTITGIIYTTNKGSSTGALSITGLPFPVRSGNPGYSGVVLYYEGITIPSGYNFIMARTSPSSTTINLYFYQSNGNYIDVTNSQCANLTQVRITYSYTTS